MSEKTTNVCVERERMIFIALQCCNCSTMQVKQQKKSSNKWSCVVCNEKQSVRKVFAQGGMARDLRSFVQSFNMSRKVADEQPEEPTVNVVGVTHRRDRSNYLQIDDDFNHSEIEPFKKPKLRGDFDGSSSAALSNKQLTCTGMERRGNKRDVQVQELRSCDEPKKASKWNHYMAQDQSLQNNWEIANASEWDIMDSNMVEEQIHPDFL